jgi:hypothetical protein
MCENADSQEPRQEQATMEEMEQATPTEAGPAEAAPEGSPVATKNDRSVWRTVGIVVAVIALVALVSALLYGLVSHPPLTATLADIAIILLALVTVVTIVFLAILIFQLQSLIVLLREELYPILDSLNKTAGTVRGTTTFVSDAIVTPMISVASTAAAIQQTIRALTGSSGRRQRARSGPAQKEQARSDTSTQG